jgi:MYXO-CTERM domain-containing protein
MPCRHDVNLANWHFALPNYQGCAHACPMKLGIHLWVALVTTVVYGGNAQARCCGADSDCPKGFACLGDADVDGGLHGFCASWFVPCECDADCVAGLVCYRDSSNVCIAYADGGAGTCQLEGQCVAPWQRPCSTNADCGEGNFTCSANGELCSGSACQPEYSCVAPSLPNTCTANADCPSGWTCEVDYAIMTKCDPTVHGCPAEGCPPPTGQMTCRPPYWELVGSNNWSGPPSTSSNCPIVDAGVSAVVDTGIDAAVITNQHNVASNSPDASATPKATDVAEHKSGCGCRTVGDRRANPVGIAAISLCLIALRRRRSRWILLAPRARLSAGI